MSNEFTFFVDGREVTGQPGQTILQAAMTSGVYIPHLCAKKELTPHGSCRVCTVRVNGRPQAACTWPAAAGMVVESETEEIQAIRRSLLEMLFVEGNHFCPFCEKSGNCELQAMGYRLGLLSPQYPSLFPEKTVDASHPDVFVDRNRCILCGRCVRASRELDGKHVFDFVGRGIHKHVAVDARARLGDTDLASTDQALDVCPVGAILRKRVGYAVPVGQRTYDHAPIGSEVEAPAAGKE